MTCIASDDAVDHKHFVIQCIKGPRYIVYLGNDGRLHRVAGWYTDHVMIVMVA